MHGDKTRSRFLRDGRERPHRPVGRLKAVKSGVAPAHLSVLAASPFLPWPRASAHFSIGLSTPAAKADPNDPPNVPSWLLFTSTAVLGVGFRFGVASNKPICPSTSSLSKITLRCGVRS